MKCNIPENEELCDLVSKVEKHRHSATCRRHGKCHFCYPCTPSSETVTARQSTATTHPEERDEHMVKALAAVRDVLDDKDTPEDISMHELLLKAGVSCDMYLCGLKICSTGNRVVMKRKPSESWINTYNPDVIRVWRANMDLEYILDPYACVMYIAAYMLKVNAQCEMVVCPCQLLLCSSGFVGGCGRVRWLSVPTSLFSVLLSL